MRVDGEDDRARDVVDSAPLFAAPPLWWFPVDEGHGIVFLSESGPTYRIDREALEIINLETTDCLLAPGTRPVVSPIRLNGRNFWIWA